jgi:hypothetical protein
MNSGSHLIEIPFHGRDIFPRNKTIRLELLEFSTCAEGGGHEDQHFAGEQRDDFPAPDKYRPTVLVRRPVPLPIVKRRRTVFFVPSMGPELMPAGRGGAPEKPKDPDDDGDDDDDDDFWGEALAGGGLGRRYDDDNWDYVSDDDQEEAAGRRQRFKRAAFSDARVTVEARFSKWAHTRTVKCNPPSTTFLSFLEKVQSSLTAIWKTEFCGLLKDGSPTFQTKEISRSRVKVILRMPASHWLAFSNSAIFKMLGFDLDEDRYFKSSSRMANHQPVARNQEPTAWTVQASEEINPNGFLTTARGMTEELDAALQEFEVSMGIDAHIQNFSWQLDGLNIICRPGDSPVVSTSLHSLNRLISLTMEVLSLDDSQGAFRASVTENGALDFPQSGGLQASPVENHADSYFRLSVAFGGEAAQALGLRPHISPIQLSSGKRTNPTGPQAFYRFDKRSEFDQEGDGGGLNATELSEFIDWLLVESAVDNTTNSIWAIETVRSLNETRLTNLQFPTWSPRRPTRTEPKKVPPPPPLQTVAEEEGGEIEAEAEAGAKVETEDEAGPVQPEEERGGEEGGGGEENPEFSVVEQEDEEFLNFAAENTEPADLDRQTAVDDYNDPRGGSGNPDDYPGATFYAKHLNWYRRQRELFVKVWKLNPDHHNYFWSDDFKQLFSTWILRRHNNKPDFEALFPPTPDEPHPTIAEKDDSELPIYIQEYEASAGGGGEATDYAGSTPEAKMASWQSHQEQIFLRRWRLPPNYRNYEWGPEYQQEFKQWMSGRLKNRPKFGDVQEPTVEVSEEILADYQDPDGGGGRPEDYKGSNFWQKRASWTKAQTELFARRWSLRADDIRNWPAEFKKEYGKWLTARSRNRPDFGWTEFTGDAGSPKTFASKKRALTRADIDHRGRSLRTSGYVQIFEEEELARPMSADELPAPSRPTRRPAKTVDPHEERPLSTAEAAEKFGDDLEQQIMAEPWEWVQIPNPRPRSPTTYPIWRSWPAPTCPPTRPLPPSPLPETFSLLCPDGERRDFFGPFGMDSFLAKIRVGRGIAFQNFCIIRNPGQRPGLKFEVVDLGYNKFAYTAADAKTPLFLKLGFRFYTLASEDDLVSYIC